MQRQGETADMSATMEAARCCASAAMDTGVEKDEGTELSGKVVERVTGGVVDAEFHDRRMGFDANESFADIFLKE